MGEWVVSSEAEAKSWLFTAKFPEAKQEGSTRELVDREVSQSQRLWTWCSVLSEREWFPNVSFFQQGKFFLEFVPGKHSEVIFMWMNFKMIYIWRNGIKMHAACAADDDMKSLKLRLKSRVEKFKLFPSNSWENIFLKIWYRWFYSPLKSYCRGYGEKI